jgi:hypothetical protein
MNKKLAFVAMIVGLFAIPLSILALGPVISEAEDMMATQLPIAPEPVRTETIGRIPDNWYYQQTWDYCVIDGEVYRDVVFSWSDLGRTMIIGDQIIYREFVITECRSTIIKE